jgi:ribosomal protein L7/L12
MSDHNINASRMIDAILGLQEIGEFNGFAESIARTSPGRFCKFAESFINGDDDEAMHEVRLLDCGKNKISCIHLIRAQTGLGLAEAKRYSETNGVGYDALYKGTKSECEKWIATVKSYGYVSNRSFGDRRREWPDGMQVEVVKI